MSGFFGCVSRRDCVADVFYGTDYHSHLGTKRGGMAFYKEDANRFVRSIHSLEDAYFRNKFEQDLPKFEGAKMGIGVISDTESQPITMTSHLGRFSIVSSARIDNMAELTEELLQKRINFAELSGSQINPTELIAILLSLGNTFKEGIELIQSKIKGSCSFLILTKDGVYAVRDKNGRTPLVVGRSEDGYVVATENSAFLNMGYLFDRELGAAEAVFVTTDGAKTIIKPQKRKQICAFLWVYYGYPSSDYEGRNVEEVRYRCGEALSMRDGDIEETIDIVAGVPDSGIGHAVGYSNSKGIPYKRAFVKYTPTWPRSFMPLNPSMRSLVAKMKLIPNMAFIKDVNMVLLDDSIVRGTQLKDNVVKLTDSGAKSIHVRIACPPLIFPCVFLNFSTSRSSLNLITHRIIKELEGTEDFTDKMLEEYADINSQKHTNMVERMRQIIDADTLRFQHLGDLVKAIGLPKEDLCTHCWDNTSYF